jgi:Fe(3+) dicitrate transport protein
LALITQVKSVKTEKIFKLENNNFSITPGFRYELINSTVNGRVTDTAGTGYLPVNGQKLRYIPLAGVAVQYRTSKTSEIYGNVTQAYTPIAYSFLYPMGLNLQAKIDPNLRDINGYNADLGFRGNIRRYVTYDVSGYYMAHNNNIAIETNTLQGMNTYYETNVGDAHHYGLETYVEVNFLKLLDIPQQWGNLSAFNSFAYDHARYVNGLYKGNVTEYAPETIERFGITYSNRGFSTTFSYSHTARSFSDANNTMFSPDAEVGIIPAYTVMDWSGTIRYKSANLKFGVNNLTDSHYFTFRTSEYPGPGIIPAMGRSLYIGFGIRL